MHHIQIVRDSQGRPLALLRRTTPPGMMGEDFYLYAEYEGFALCRHDPDDEHWYVHLDREQGYRAVRQMVTMMHGTLDDPEGILAADASTSDPVETRPYFRTTVLIAPGALQPVAHIRTVAEDAVLLISFMPGWKAGAEDDTFTVPVIEGVNDRRLAVFARRYMADVVDPEGALTDALNDRDEMTDIRSEITRPANRSTHEHRHESTVPGYYYQAPEQAVAQEHFPAW